MNREHTPITIGSAGIPDSTDVLVIGLGVTGAGVALDAVTRGLDVVAVEAHDIAWGTSRWSSKLVHGGLRYLAKGQLGVAHESAVERGILMQTTAPHLVHALPILIPLTSKVTRFQGFLARRGAGAGDLLRFGARTRRETLPRPRRISATEARTLAPVVRHDIRGGILSWDGQLEDDARLVLDIARTAAAHGARLHTRTRVLEATGNSVVLRDELTGETRTIRASAVINSTGVWAAGLVDGLRLKPSRGTHIVVRKASLPGVRCAVMAPVPDTTNRFVFALPQPDGTFYIGLTDEEASGEIPDVPQPPEEDIAFLLRVINQALHRPLTRGDVVGAYAGLRPLLDSDGSTADLSRKHAVLVSSTGVITIVGGKLTTYRRMAQDAVDRAVENLRGAGPCRTRTLPLLGAASPAELAELAQPERLVRRFGTEAALVLANAVEVSGLSPAELLSPVSADIPITLAELIFGTTHEGALDVDDLLDRRTRIGLVPEDREQVVPLAERALELVAKHLQESEPTS